MLALFFVRFCRVSDVALTPSELRRFGLLAGLAFVNRIDSVTLYLAPLVWLALRAFRRRDERVFALVVAFAAPAAAWLIFATVYYGFPLPNTYYAKVATGIPAALLHRQGFAYLLNSFAHDPVTLGTVGVLAAVAIRASAPLRLSAVSALLLCGLYRVGRRRLHERPVLRDAVPGRGHCPDPAIRAPGVERDSCRRTRRLQPRHADCARQDNRRLRRGLGLALAERDQG